MPILLTNILIFQNNWYREAKPSKTRTAVSPPGPPGRKPLPSSASPAPSTPSRSTRRCRSSWGCIGFGSLGVAVSTSSRGSTETGGFWLFFFYQILEFYFLNGKNGIFMDSSCVYIIIATLFWNY